MQFNGASPRVPQNREQLQYASDRGRAEVDGKRSSRCVMFRRGDGMNVGPKAIAISGSAFVRVEPPKGPRLEA